MRVAELPQALAEAEAVFTVTGRPGILRRDELLSVRDGAMLANVGHFGTEIDVPALEELAVERRRLAHEMLRTLSAARVG